MSDGDLQKSREVELLEIIRRLEVKIAGLLERNALLEAELAKARKNSSTSSKPPSSDIVKPKRHQKSGDNKKRKRGGQPGHSMHDRPPFSDDQVDQIHLHTLDVCPDCGGRLEPADTAPRVIQQIEVVEKPIHIDEHRGQAHWCGRCEIIHYAPLPPEVVAGGLIGPNLTGWVAYLKSVCHASYSTIRKFFRDVLQIKISRGQLVKLINKATAALQPAYDQLMALLPQEDHLRVDETGHRDNGRRFWTWCFRADAFCLFMIDESRGSKVLCQVLGTDFDGVLSCDYFSAYRKYMKDCDVRVQFCLAHLIRDLKYLTTLRDPATVAYGEKLLDAMRDLFHHIHQHESMPAAMFQNRLCDIRDQILILARTNVPDTNEAFNLAQRFEHHGQAYFQFITTPGIEPTNNLAEQALRFVVIDRHVTQGTRSANGRSWCERIWTVLATCARQDRSAFTFICQAIQAHFTGQPPPSILPT